ncbi:MAG: CapA family protein, partial [Sphingopyxis granuli]
MADIKGGRVMGSTGFDTPTRRRLLKAGFPLIFLPVVAGAGRRPLRISLLGQSLIKTDLRRIGWRGLGEFRRILAGRDLVFTDLETVIGGPLAGRSTRPADSEVLHVAEPEVIDCLQAIGVNIVATSNNHAWDLDTGGIVSTIEALRARGLAFAGTGRDLAQASA